MPHPTKALQLDKRKFINESRKGFSVINSTPSFTEIKELPHSDAAVLAERRIQPSSPLHPLWQNGTESQTQAHQLVQPSKPSSDKFSSKDLIAAPGSHTLA